MNYLVTILITFLSLNASADCPQFATALEAAMKKVTARNAAKSTPRDDIEGAMKQKWSSPEAEEFKVKYGASYPSTENRTFMTFMEADKRVQRSDVLYFDVENAVQKKLNDSLIGDKAMVDAVNNSFMSKFAKNLKENPEIASRVEGQYKDYKSLRLRLSLKPGDNAAELEGKLSEIYKKTNQEFVSEFEKDGLTKLLPPRTDEVPDVSTWFLSGTGDSALEANMAARGARGAGFSRGNARSVSFKQQVENMHADVSSIESIRKTLAGNESLLKSGIMTKTAEGAVVPSKDMIAILRKIKPSDCESAAEYALKIRSKVKNLFNSDISDKHIDELTKYFEKVDSISPPLFQRERVAINLGEAQKGIVSVDFTGVGVDNAYEQMRALSSVNYGQTDKVKLLKEAFGKVQSNVDGVTSEMNLAKRSFTVASRNPDDLKSIPKFSGDDGILMPKVNWTTTQKTTLVKQLSETGDPSKFRVTFVKTQYGNGGMMPIAERSQRVVRAETIEKSTRDAMTGTGKVSSERAKKMIIAIDYDPAPVGGKFNIVVGGVKPTEEERKIILDAFRSTLHTKEGESAGDMVEAF